MMSARQISPIPPPVYISGRFDRRTFSPGVNPDHKRTLRVLRQHGNARRYYYEFAIQADARKWAHYEPHWDLKHSHLYCCGSEALKFFGRAFAYLDEREGARSETYLDLGCGDSPDADIAKGLGYNAYGVDLFGSRQKNLIWRMLKWWNVQSTINGFKASRRG